MNHLLALRAQTLERSPTYHLLMPLGMGILAQGPCDISLGFAQQAQSPSWKQLTRVDGAPSLRMLCGDQSLHLFQKDPLLQECTL